MGTISQATYFENSPILGLYLTHHKQMLIEAGSYFLAVYAWGHSRSACPAQGGVEPRI